jgi:hypothetical protein
MQNQINLSPITQLIQQIRSAELSQAKNISIDIHKARLLALALSEIQDKLLQDYETMFNQLKNSIEPEVVNVSMDGGGFEDKK